MSIHPRVWLNGLLGVFKPLEKALLGCLIEKMPAGTREVLRRQVSEITLVQRHEAGRVANFYRVVRGVTLENLSVRLYGAPREQILGKMRFRAHSGTELKAEFWAIEGRLFSMELSTSPRSDIRYSDFTLLKFECFPRRTEPKPKQLPSDYESLASSNEFVLKFDEIYEVGIGSIQYWVLAEVPDLGLLGVEQHSSDRTLYFLPYSGGDPTKLGTALAGALATISVRTAGRS